MREGGEREDEEGGEGTQGGTGTRRKGKEPTRSNQIVAAPVATIPQLTPPFEQLFLFLYLRFRLLLVLRSRAVNQLHQSHLRRCSILLWEVRTLCSLLQHRVSCCLIPGPSALPMAPSSSSGSGFTPPPPSSARVGLSSPNKAAAHRHACWRVDQTAGSESTAGLGSRMGDGSLQWIVVCKFCRDSKRRDLIIFPPASLRVFLDSEQVMV